MERTPVVQEHEQRIEELEKQYAVLKKRLSWLENKNAEPGMAELLKDKQDAAEAYRQAEEEFWTGKPKKRDP